MPQPTRWRKSRGNLHPRLFTGLVLVWHRQHLVLLGFPPRCVAMLRRSELKFHGYTPGDMDLRTLEGIGEGGVWRNPARHARDSSTPCA